MPTRISKVEHEYGGRPLVIGEKIEVEDRHVALLLAMGWIEPQQGEPGYVQQEPVRKKKRFG